MSTPDTKQQMQKAANLLKKLVSDNTIKLAFGYRLRQENKEALARGERPVNYRMEWLKEARNKCVSFLQDLAADFNRKYPHDCCSVLDLLDVLHSASHQFQTAVKSENAKQEKDS